MKIAHWCVCLLFGGALSAQDGPAVTVSTGPPPRAYQTLNFYDGSNRLIYQCQAPSWVPETAPSQIIAVTAASNANPVSFTATAHGLDFRTAATINPIIKITGGTGNWAAINGVWTATVTSANAFTIAVDSTAFGALAGTLVVTTTSPRITQSVWAIRNFIYDVAGNLLSTAWAAKTAGGAGATDTTAGNVAMDKACGSRTTYSYQ